MKDLTDLTDAMAHLYCARAQHSLGDDEIIANHITDAYQCLEVLKGKLIAEHEYVNEKLHQIMGDLLTPPVEPQGNAESSTPDV